MVKLPPNYIERKKKARAFASNHWENSLKSFEKNKISINELIEAMEILNKIDRSILYDPNLNFLQKKEIYDDSHK